MLDRTRSAVLELSVLPVRRSGRRQSPGPLIQVNTEIALGLALYTWVIDGGNPTARRAIVRNLSVSAGRMAKVVNVQHDNPDSGVLNYD
ncbi:MAG TPA: hypothetical protein VIX19_03660 [Terriglobales bacterium]